MDDDIKITIFITKARVNSINRKNVANSIISFNVIFMVFVLQVTIKGFNTFY